MRRIAAQVPSAVSRLLQGNHIRYPPAWYAPVLSHPPPQLPAYQVRPRARRGDPSLRPGEFTDANPISKHVMERRERGKLRAVKPVPEGIHYEEDVVRRQFFKDFPFEALRPVSLVEGREIDISEKVVGKEWTTLEQRGQYPTVEDCVAFVLNLHHFHDTSMSDAYILATEEFAVLRARHQLATMAAELEARHYGVEFKPDVFERAHNLEEKSLSTLDNGGKRAAASGTGRQVASHEWSNIVPPEAKPLGYFTGGQAYVKRWKLPKPIRGGKSAGDLLSQVGTAEAAEEGEKPVEEESRESDLDLLEAALGGAGSSRA
ncbi:hypothetical protein IAT38_005134 [Cryptococcus sp. DSM 104549]